MKRFWLGCVVSLSLMAGASSLFAQEPKADAEAEMKAATTAARAAAKVGPTDIPLQNQAALKLPAGYVFVPQPEADQMMKAMGNGTDSSRLGLIFPPNGNAFVVAKYFNSGYIKDEEAKNWKTDELLEQLKEGTKESNKERAARGIPEIEVVGWVQKPTYEPGTHRLVWSLESKDKNSAANSAHGVNYNTYVLGREGYLSLNLVTGAESLAQNKEIAATLLQATSFNSGKGYGDFNASTDKIAEYGIAALVAGVAAKKLGLFAVIAAFVLKFAKVIGVAVFALFGGAGRFFKRKQATAPSGSSNGSDNSTI